MNPKDFTLHSGGANGSDFQFEIIGREFGVINFIHYWYGKMNPHSLPEHEITVEDYLDGVEMVHKANTILNYCCSFDSNIVPTNPANSVITTTNDGSYGFYVRLNDLANGASDQFSWYYAAGELADLAGIIGDVAAASGAVSNIDSNSATFKATTSADGTGYWVVVPRDATAPTEAQIKARANYAGVSVLASGSAAMTDSVEKSFAINGLQPGTDYDLYFVSEDAVPSFSSVVKAQFATIPYVAPVGAEAIPTLSEWALLILVALMGLFGITQLRQRKSA